MLPRSIHFLDFHPRRVAQLLKQLVEGRLHQFEAACRAVAKCKDVPMLMDGMLIAAEEVGDATYARCDLAGLALAGLAGGR